MQRAPANSLLHVMTTDVVMVMLEIAKQINSNASTPTNENDQRADKNDEVIDVIGPRVHS
jgi:hypothetical protein